MAVRVRRARADHQARVRAVADGTAEPEVYAALKYAYAVADRAPEDRRVDARSPAVTLVADAIGNALRAGDPIDAEVIGKAAAAQIRRTTEFMASGGFLAVFGFLRPDTRTIDRVRSDLEEARRPPPDPVVSSLAERNAENAAVQRAQVAALEGLLSLAERQAKTEPVLVWLAGISAVAAVVAAVAAIIGLF
jgi:hypothetical protein